MQETPFLVRQTNMEKEGKVFFISSESETLLIARKMAHVFEKLSPLISALALMHEKISEKSLSNGQ